MEEAVGFEPTVPLGTSDFKSGALNRARPRFLGANDRVRTCDLTIIGRLLYQLSYTRT